MVSGINDAGATASVDRAKAANSSAAMAASSTVAGSAAANATEVRVNGDADRQQVEQMNVSEEKSDAKAKNRVARYFQKSE